MAKVVKVLLAFASAQIHTEAIGVDLTTHSRFLHGLLGSAYGKLGMTTTLLPLGRVLANVGKRPIPHFRCDACWEIAGVEQSRIPNARLSFLEIGPEFGNSRAQGSY